ncbi:hypothetical protein IV203_012447 [Nitzschia inconspicua]|uniref:Uncharacterized protein n=1 Tax=Nitzschia inconspicua TaxID=303405 RepID=A0A9K3KTX4_9STRA|nr:hypothetical protein IV203_012447 [Nitzschia inconspicua]
MSSKPPKQDDSQHQRQASVTLFQGIIDNPSFTEIQKRDVLRSVIQRQLRKRDHSFINPNSPFTKSFLDGIAIINEYAATPDRPSLQRELCYDFVVKKIETVLPAQMEQPLVPQGEASGARKLEFPKSTPPVIQDEDTNNIPKENIDSIALQVEKGNEPTPANRTTAGNCQKIQAKRKASEKLTESERVLLAIQQKEQRKKARNNSLCDD